MPTYQYEAMDNTGTEIKETIEAESEAEAQQLIRDKGFFVTNITEQQKKKKKKATEKKQAGPKKKKTLSLGKVKAKQLCTFTRQLSTLQDAGLPVLRSLKILEGQAKPGPLKNALDGVVEDIESGNTLSESMAKQPKAFDELYVNMVRAGEASGALEIILQRLADFKERARDGRASKSAKFFHLGRHHGNHSAFIHFVVESFAAVWCVCVDGIIDGISQFAHNIGRDDFALIAHGKFERGGQEQCAEVERAEPDQQIEVFARHRVVEHAAAALAGWGRGGAGIG